MIPKARTPAKFLERTPQSTNIESEVKRLVNNAIIQGLNTSVREPMPIRLRTDAPIMMSAISRCLRQKTHGTLAVEECYY